MARKHRILLQSLHILRSNRIQEPMICGPARTASRRAVKGIEAIVFAELIQKDHEIGRIPFDMQSIPAILL